MKILLVNNYWYRRGGSETVVFATKRLLEAAGHTVVCFGISHPDNEVALEYAVPMKMHANGEFVHGMHGIYNIKAKRLFERCLKEVQPDVVHMHNIYHHLSWSICDAVRKANVRAVMTLHDYKLISLQYKMYHHGHIDTDTKNNICKAIVRNVMEKPLRTIGAVLEYVVRRMRKSTDVFQLFLCPSQFLSDMCAASGISSERLRVVHNPLDPELVKSDTGIAYHNRHGVLFAGRLVPEKGSELMSQITELLPTIPFFLAGSGVYSGTSTNVKTLGHLTAQELKEQIDSARLMIVPSQWLENAPMSIVEALSRGVVVLGSDLGGISEQLPASWCVTKYADANEWAKKITTWYFDTDAKEVDILREDRQKQVCTKHSVETYIAALEHSYND